MSKKSDRKKLKGPDAIEVKGTELLDKMESNKNLIGGVLGGVFLAIAAYQGVGYYQAKKVEDQISALSVIDASFRNEAKVVLDKKDANRKEIDKLRLAIQKDKKLKKLTRRK